VWFAWRRVAPERYESKPRGARDTRDCSRSFFCPLEIFAQENLDFWREKEKP
jgi:hypothetical protein